MHLYPLKLMYISCSQKSKSFLSRTNSPWWEKKSNSRSWFSLNFLQTLCFSNNTTSLPHRCTKTCLLCMLLILSIKKPFQLRTFMRLLIHWQVFQVWVLPQKPGERANQNKCQVSHYTVIQDFAQPRFNLRHFFCISALIHVRKCFNLMETLLLARFMSLPNFNIFWSIQKEICRKNVSD